MLGDDDSENEEEQLYADGEWIWNDTLGQLEFLNFSKEEVVQPIHKLIVVSKIKFNDNFSPLELNRFSKYFRRKSLDENKEVIMLQDVKDFVLFSAPSEILTLGMILLLHTPITDRYLRSLILYTQYFLQVSETMENRSLIFALKIRREEDETYENSLSKDLQDLRVLVGREYSQILLGMNTYAKYHHKGKSKNWPSLSRRDANFHECFIKVCIQIIYIALHRKDYNGIDKEINRLLKSEEFGHVDKFAGRQRQPTVTPMAEKLKQNVLKGKVLNNVKRGLQRVSPLIQEIMNERPGYPPDCRLLLAGNFVIPGPTSPRLLFFERMLTYSEQVLTAMVGSLGIIGLPRPSFDTELKLIPVTHIDSSRSSARFSGPRLYFTEEFETIPLALIPCNQIQKQRWIRRVRKRLMRGKSDTTMTTI